MEPRSSTDLSAELCALRARVAELERRPVTRAPQRRRPRVSPLPALLLALLLGLVPYAVLAAGFSDQGQFSPTHAPNIQAIADAGITVGFDDPNSDDPDDRLFSPAGTVSREEMATFLARTAGLGANPPVANAKTAQTATSATNAANAAQLGGAPASAYVQSNTSPTFADLTVTGAIGQAYAPGTTNRAAPLAYAFIKNDGTVSSGTPNVSARYDPTYKWYEITITGEQYIYHAYQTVVTANSASAFMSTGSSNGKLLVSARDALGNPTNPGDGFQFITYKP